MNKEEVLENLKLGFSIADSELAVLGLKPIDLDVGTWNKIYFLLTENGCNYTESKYQTIGRSLLMLARTIGALSGQVPKCVVQEILHGILSNYSGD